MKKLLLFCLMMFVTENTMAQTGPYSIGDTGPAGGTIFYFDEANEFDWTYLEAAPAETEAIGVPWGTWKLQVPLANNEAIGTGKDNTEAILGMYWSQFGTGGAWDGQTAVSIPLWTVASGDAVNLHPWMQYKASTGQYFNWYWQTTGKGMILTGPGGVETGEEIDPAPGLLQIEDVTDYAAKLAWDLEVTNNGETYDDWFLPSRYELVEMKRLYKEEGLGGFSDDGFYWMSSDPQSSTDYDGSANIFSSPTLDVAGIFAKWSRVPGGHQTNQAYDPANSNTGQQRVRAIRTVTVEMPVTNVTQGTSYFTIQDAITAATTGDVIEVADGSYTENVTINQTNLTLQSVNALGATITGNLTVSNGADNTTIDGFNINPSSGTGIAVWWAANVTISNNYFDGNSGAVDGITFSHSSSPAIDGGTITGNEFADCDFAVNMDHDGVYDFTVTGNTIDAARKGIGFGSLAGGTIENNTIKNCSSAGIEVFKADVTTVHNNSIYNNSPNASSSDGSNTLNAEENWWGSAVAATIETGLSGDIDYDPWVGMEETSTVSTTGTPVSYPASGTTLNFSTLPSGGGTVSVKRYNTAPPVAPPAGASVAPIYFEITSSMANYTFNTTVVLNVSGISGFTGTTQVAYYNTTTSKWVFIPVTPDAYDAGAGTYTFTTDHFTTFSFINTPATAKNLYLASLATATSSSIIYPNDEWDGTVGNDDWDFQSPISLYIVPEAGTEFGSCSITLQWDSELFTFSSVDNGGLFEGLYFKSFYTQFGTTDQLIIDASTLDNSNFSVNSGEYIAQLNLNLVNPGYGTINITSEDFRNLDGAGGFEGVYMTPNNASVKSYLGDVAAIGTPTDESTGDGLVEIEDLSLWSSSYWYGVDPTATGYKVKYDVGPTSTNTVYGLPQPDSKIQFEDLVIFAMSYGLSGDNVYPKVTPVDMPVELYLGEPVLAGSETRIPVMVKGGVQNIRAMQLSFAGRFGKLLSVEKGALLTGTENPVMVLSRESGSNVYADFAFFGADEKGINTEGEILVLRFDGNAEVNISSAEVRNILNNEMGVELTGEENAMPTTFDLSQNYPNPFNPTTLIKYQLPEDRQVVLKVFNALGQQVTELVNEVQQAGYYEVQMNGLNMSSGVYFYHLTAGDFTSVKKMMLIK